MEKLWKYCLSIGLVVWVVSCGENSTVKTAAVQDKALAEQVYEEGSHLLQGSPESMTRIEKAIALDTTYAEAIRELSVAYLKRGMPHKWKPIFDKAVEHDAATWQPWRGYLYLWFYRDYKKAIADFNASDTLTPNFIDQPQGHSVDYWRGIAYLGLKDYNSSIAYWNRHIQKETAETGEDWVEINAFLYRGIAHYESGDTQKALLDFDKVIGLFKQSADAKYYKAKVLFEREDYDAAEALVNDAITDYNGGFYNQRNYVETLRQLYPVDLKTLKESILRQK
ncbi:tetratricopeptide repeat protein [Maribacter sp. 2-571]|uniref:tetratricopeptide repeat protein n=1 Tax=Maribacter sp. 2-571 TaxID=3417569 RepID=UPI003D3439B4